MGLWSSINDKKDIPLSSQQTIMYIFNLFTFTFFPTNENPCFLVLSMILNHGYHYFQGCVAYMQPRIIGKCWLWRSDQLFVKLHIDSDPASLLQTKSG